MDELFPVASTEEVTVRLEKPQFLLDLWGLTADIYKDVRKVLPNLPAEWTFPIATVDQFPEARAEVPLATAPFLLRRLQLLRRASQPRHPVVQGAPLIHNLALLENQLVQLIHAWIDDPSAFFYEDGVGPTVGERLSRHIGPITEACRNIGELIVEHGGAVEFGGTP